MKIKAITLWQPYASLIALGEKKYETRSWKTNYRGWLAIHAAKRKPVPVGEAGHILAEAGYGDWDQLPRGAVLAVARLTRVFTTNNRDWVFSLNDLELAFGNYRIDRYAWRLEDVTPIGTRPARGYQGLWDWDAPPEVAQLLKAEAAHD